MVNDTQMVIQILYTLLKLGFHKGQAHAENQIKCLKDTAFKKSTFKKAQIIIKGNEICMQLYTIISCQKIFPERICKMAIKSKKP